MKVFISQPMDGKSDEEIQKIKDVASAMIKDIFGDENIEIIDSFIKNSPPKGLNVPVWYLSNSILLMSNADLVYFAEGWKKSRGCVIENAIAIAYNLCTIETQ